MATLSIDPNERVTYKVRYEDADLLVVAKSAGIVTTPGKGHERDSLLNGLFHAYGPKLQNVGKDRDFGLLHRLDRTTSGLLIVALNTHVYDALREAFKAREIAKFYWAVTKQAPKTPKGVINKPILEYKGESAGDSRTKKLSRVSSSGKPALTAYRTLATSAVAALLECRAITGRLHQIRVHLDSIGCAILGDEMYGPASVRDASPRLALHAHRVNFTHPISGKKIDVRSPWPADLRSMLHGMSLPRPDEMKPAKANEETTDPAEESGGSDEELDAAERGEHVDGMDEE